MARYVPREWSSGGLGEQAVLRAAALLEVPGSPAVVASPLDLPVLCSFLSSTFHEATIDVKTNKNLKVKSQFL